MTFMLPSDASNVGVFDNVILDAVVVANIIGGRSERWWYKPVKKGSSPPRRFPRYARFSTPHLISRRCVFLVLEESSVISDFVKYIQCYDYVILEQDQKR